MRLVSTALVCLLAAAAFSADQNGLKPRKSVADYAGHDERNGVAMAASLLSRDEVKKLFATDLNGGGYAVVEVAVYPKEGETVDLSADDFSLRAAGDRTTWVRPARPRTIAAVLQKDTSKGSRDVDLYPTGTIGYESGGGYDPVTGRRRGRGVYTGAGVGVGVGGSGAPGPASTPADLRTMEMELSAQALPDGPTAKPVAGYLYFPLPAKRKSVLYELEYSGQTMNLTIALPPNRVK